MRRLVLWLSRWILVLLALNVAFAASRMAFHSLSQSSGWGALWKSPPLWALISGWVFRILCTRWRRQDPWEFLDTLEHELTHAAAGAVTFAPPISLKATLRKGGEVELLRTNPVAVLAPYCLPLYAAAAALLTLLLRSELLPYGRFAVGFLIGSFAYRLGRELHWGQTDFRNYGLPFSCGFIAAMLPLCLSGILATARIFDLPWRHGVWPLSMDQLQWLVHTARHLAAPRGSS